MPSKAADSRQATFTDSVARKLDPAFSQLCPILDTFVSRHKVSKWIILSDYVLRQNGRPMSTVAFTLMPAGIYYDHIVTLAQKAARKDFKDSKHIASEMLDFLVYRRLFTVCLTFRDRPMPSLSADDVRSFVSRSIEHMERGMVGSGNIQLYKKLKRLKQEAEAKSFNHLLVGDLVFVPAVAAYIGLQVARRTRVERLGWFSDRDKIVEAHQELAKDLFVYFVAQFWQEIQKGCAGPELGALESGSWYDFMIRVPDHFASAIAGWDLSPEGIGSLGFKYQQVIELAGKYPTQVQIVHID